MREKSASTTPMSLQSPNGPEGILLIDKPKGRTSFSLIGALRRRLGVKKIGHAGTLDPFATGVMILLVGRQYTRQSDSFLGQDKEYIAKMRLGITTDTYDADGETISTSDLKPTKEEFESVLLQFQGDLLQVPPMYSAKKIQGKKLYELARQGKTVERAAVPVNVTIDLINFDYPFVDIRVRCSKGTYIRSLAYDMGEKLGCGAHLKELCRTRSGQYLLEECLDGNLIGDPNTNVLDRLRV